MFQKILNIFKSINRFNRGLLLFSIVILWLGFYYIIPLSEELETYKYGYMFNKTSNAKMYHQYLICNKEYLKELKTSFDIEYNLPTIKGSTKNVLVQIYPNTLLNRVQIADLWYDDTSRDELVIQQEWFNKVIDNTAFMCNFLNRDFRTWENKNPINL